MTARRIQRRWERKSRMGGDPGCGSSCLLSLNTFDTYHRKRSMQDPSSKSMGVWCGNTFGKTHYWPPFG